MFFTDSYQALRRGERQLALRYALLSVLILALIGVPFGFFMLRRVEKAITFHPEREPWGGSWKLPQGAEDVYFKAADDTRLHGWFVHASEQPARATIIYFHGNGGNLSYVDWVGEKFARRGCDVLLFDYRGYGRSEGKATDERALYQDADAAYDYVVKERGASPAQLVLYGQSLGTTAVAELASRRPCGAIILESGLSSASDMAAVVLPWLPRWVHGLTRNKFESARKLAGVSCPVLVVHGDRDEIIPVEQGHALFVAAHEPKQLIIMHGAGHNDLSIVGGAKYVDMLAAFIANSIPPR